MVEEEGEHGGYVKMDYMIVENILAFVYFIRH